MNISAQMVNRKALNGMVGSYIHLYGKIGVLVEINCETDFVANTEEFKEFVKNIGMQIAASNPKFITREEVPNGVIEKEKEIFYAQVEKSGKPAPVIEKIVEGKMVKYFK